MNVCHAPMDNCHILFNVNDGVGPRRWAQCPGLTRGASLASLQSCRRYGLTPGVRHLANTSSAQKRIRQEQKRRIRNRSQRTRLKTAIKKVLSAPDAASAEAALTETSALLDRLASRHLIHRNKAARKKSQLAHRVNTLKNAG